jgi:hypothetical protein
LARKTRDTDRHTDTQTHDIADHRGFMFDV